MSKSKQAPALFEMMQRESAPETQLNELNEAHKSGKHRSLIQKLAKKLTRLTQEEPGQRPRREPWIRTEADRIHFSLSTLGLATTIFVAVMVMAAAFGLGWQMAPDGTGQKDNQALLQSLADENIQAALEQPPQPGVVSNLSAVNTELQVREVRERRAAGVDPQELNYIWIETFHTYQDAVNAQQYLLSENIESVQVEKDGKWRLFTTRGFDYQIPEEKAECLEWVRRIKQIGREYLQAGGRYRFDCLPIKLKTNFWQSDNGA